MLHETHSVTLLGFFKILSEVPPYTQKSELKVRSLQLEKPSSLFIKLEDFFHSKYNINLLYI